MIENGFFIMILLSGRAFSPEDLNQNEAKMHELAEKNYSVSRKVVSRDEAVKFFKDLGEEYESKNYSGHPAR